MEQIHSKKVTCATQTQISDHLSSCGLGHSTAAAAAAAAAATAAAAVATAAAATVARGKKNRSDIRVSNLTSDHQRPIYLTDRLRDRSRSAVWRSFDWQSFNHSSFVDGRYDANGAETWVMIQASLRTMSSNTVGEPGSKQAQSDGSFRLIFTKRKIPA